ncbi:myotubularin-related protein 14-like isoform X1 [Patiria miniata]|uniref:Tyrosine specific protein phosphatases domain-containing protein n=1 Tax=Patiria miniata TaxID=46514 RepID=A0A913Z7U5_PATMI|nr:myotubularin-related protein 14-like isoform X1 [Patiria miniata]
MGEGLVSDSELRQLLFIFCKSGYKARETSSKVELIERKCLALFGKDYKYTVIYNSNGELCGHYPEKLVILEYMQSGNGQDEKTQQSIEPLYDIQKIRELMLKSRFARCRQRFVIPIIMYEGKHICRSATLSGGPEIYGRSGLDYFFSGGESLGTQATDSEDLLARQNAPTSSSTGSNEWPLFDRFRGQDIKLLKMLSVGCISDLMVENKKVKFGMNVSSSEKVDKEHRYADFDLVSVPYPGCEFFRDYRENGFNAEGLYYDWSQDFVDAGLSIPENLSSKLGIDWKSYRSWDLVKITQNYLKLFLHVVKEGETGLLVHCISGWDRTPLFVSLLRLTLWADGVAHRNLNAAEILYLTIAYDWMLFGHNLSDRIGKGEDIFFFCFNFLKHITSDEFSVAVKRNKRSVSRTDSESCMDGMVLLDVDKQCLGSNSSLNSNISVTSLSSTSSPILICTGGPHEDITNGSLRCYGSPALDNGKPRTPTHREPPRSPPATSATSPVAVPRQIRRSSGEAAKSAASSTCGSWQLVSQTGSVKGHVSSRDSPLSVHSDVSSSSSGTASTGAVFDSICEESERKRKLDEVRITFNKLYCAIIGSRYTVESGGISSMIDSIASKVGFRSGRGTPV